MERDASETQGAGSEILSREPEKWPLFEADASVWAMYVEQRISDIATSIGHVAMALSELRSGRVNDLEHGWKVLNERLGHVETAVGAMDERLDRVVPTIGAVAEAAAKGDERLGKQAEAWRIELCKEIERLQKMDDHVVGKVDSLENKTQLQHDRVSVELKAIGSGLADCARQLGIQKDSMTDTKPGLSAATERQRELNERMHAKVADNSDVAASVGGKISGADKVRARALSDALTMVQDGARLLKKVLEDRG